MIVAPGADAGAADLAGDRVVRDPAAPAARAQHVTVTARAVNPADLAHQARARTKSPTLLTIVLAWRPAGAGPRLPRTPTVAQPRLEPGSRSDAPDSSRLAAYRALLKGKQK
jgi:hypothetical protein